MNTISRTVPSGKGLRNWAPETYAEVFIRLNDYEQPLRHVAHMTGLSLMQIQYFKAQLDASPTSLPKNLRFPSAEVFDEMRATLEEQIPQETIRRRGRPKKDALPPMPPEQLASLQSEVAGCIDLAKQVAEVYGISARNFLHRCLTDARSR